eukprot:GHVH01000476.1.p3 GENE.GHVH01000476.1~~GHVH01000476.1.p3  ORF type:complete len:181 (-),score=39.93 GHVH01000476.1:1019-1561(-)
MQNKPKWSHPAEVLTLCDVCLSAPKKYTFKCCSGFFCSVDCAKKHEADTNDDGVCPIRQAKDESERVDEQAKAAEVSSESEDISSIDDSEDVDNVWNEDEAGVLTSLNKQMIAKSDDVKEWLKSVRLRDAIVDIDTSKDRAGTLAAYLQDPEFSQFCDVIFNLLGYENPDQITDMNKMDP